MSKKSRKLARSGGAHAAPKAEASAEQPPRDDPYAEFAGREWNFWFLPDASPDPVDEKALHSLMKDWRHGRASRTIGQMLGDAYFMIFSLVLVGAMVINLVLQSQQGMAGCATDTCQTGRTLLPWGLYFGVATLTLSISRIFGPVMASAPEGSWLMEAPISRTRLLAGRLWGALALTFVVGGALAALITALSGTPGLLIVAWVLATGLTASGLMAVAAVEQSYERTVPLRALQFLFGLAATAVVVWLVLVSAGRVALVVPDWADLAPWALAAAGALASLVFGVVAHRRLNAIRRARLLSGGSLVSGMQGAMFALDLGLARDILVERDAVARGHVRPTKGRWLGAKALAWRDLQRLVRFPKPLLGLLAAALVPYAVDALGLSFVMPFFAALALVAALIPFLGSLRVLSRTGGLARTMPLSTREIRNATMIVPAGLALIWAVAIFPAVLGFTGGETRPLVDAVSIAVSMGAAGLLGAVRWQTAKQVDFSTPMVATNAGAMPPTLIFNLFRGLDIVAVVTAPIILGAPMWVSLAIAGIVYLLLRSGANLADMQEEAKEQQKLLDEEKSKRKGANTPEKIRIQRPTR